MEELIIIWQLFDLQFQIQNELKKLSQEMSELSQNEKVRPHFDNLLYKFDKVYWIISSDFFPSTKKYQFDSQLKCYYPRTLCKLSFLDLCIVIDV